jgi:toxin FitB
MIVVDTNVLSEMMKPLPSAQVVRWMNTWPVLRLYTTTIPAAELLYGLHLTPSGKRRNVLRQEIKNTLEKDFSGRILTFGLDAARAFADIASQRRRMVRPIMEMDAQIAAIARSQGAAIATRNISDFQDCGVPLIDPWA